MIQALEPPGPLVSREIAGVFYDHDRTPVARRIFADRTDLLIGQVLTDFAEGHVLLGTADRVGETVHACGRHSYNMKSKPLRGFIADAGKTRQFIDQFVDIAGV